jgi:predicted DNA-binding protein with PD1-like motif
MDFKRFDNKIIIRIDRGEELVETLKKFCEEQNIKLGSISGIGAANKITLGLFNTETKEYVSRELTGDHEIIPLMGNISTMNGELYLHLHANISDAENHSFGGHLNSALISGTFEGFIDVVDGEVDREKSEEVGLNLYKFDQ